MATKKALCWAVVVTLPTAAHAGQCTQKFISCVQATGNPAACYSVSAACDDSVVTEIDEAGLGTTLETTSEMGRAYAWVSVKNVATEARQTGVLLRQVRCADGTMEPVYFPLNLAIAPGATATSAKTVVCFGQPSASIATHSVEASSDVEPEAIETASFSCGPSSTTTIELTPLKWPKMRYKTSSGIFGVYDFGENAPELFQHQVCDIVAGEETNLIVALKEFLLRQSNENSIPVLDSGNQSMMQGVRN